MLRFEKLFIQGFKSFNDPTEIVFDEEGITGVVGPNGCGKSNVADAISWVIGEQRIKSLRGSKMEDVIFTGSRNRQPAGLAEVILTLKVIETFEIRSDIGKPNQAEVNQALAAGQAETESNQANAPIVDPETAASASITDQPNQAALAVPPVDGAEPQSVTPAEADAPVTTETGDEPEAAEKKKKAKLPPKVQAKSKVATKEISRVYHQGERITVGRRLYRTGESEYELNGRGCRLRDIADLFSGTGLGGAHYAIIEQGRIGQVLSAKPLDRRSLIEEAAGISKFKLRQHQAELKLEASKTNLSRIHDILLEIERQQNSLKRQAQKARRFQRLKQEQRDLMRAVFVVDYRFTRNTIDDLTQRLAEVVQLEQTAAEQLTTYDGQQAEIAQQARVAEERLNEARAEAAELDLETERAKQQHAYLKEQLNTLGQRSQQFARDQEAISERNDFIAQETTRLRAALAEIEQEINAESKALADEEALHRSLADNDAAAERKLEEARKQLYEQTTTLERWRQLQRQFTEAVDRAQTRLNGLATERERANAQVQAAIERHAELSLQFEETSLKQTQTSDALNLATAELNAQRLLRETQQTALNQLHRELTATEQRLKSLTELDQRRTYFSESVQLLMKQQDKGFTTLGTLADFVQVPSEFEATVETGLRDELQYVVVPSYGDALRAIEFLKAEDGGRATFLVVNQTSGQTGNPQAFATNGESPNGQRTLSSLLGMRPEFAESFTLALPSLAHAKVVETAENAVVASQQLNGNGHVVALSKTGERAIAGRLVTGGTSTEKATGVLALKREMVELGEKVETLAARADAQESELVALNTHINLLTEQRNELDLNLRQLDKRVAVEREQVQQAERERERTSTYIRVVETETTQAQTEFNEFNNKLTHAEDQMVEAERAHAEAANVVSEAQNAIAELRRVAEQRTQDLSRRRAEFAARTERRRGMQNDLRRLENETSDLTSRLSRARLESVETEEHAENLRASIETLAAKLTEFTAEQQEFAQELNLRAQALTAAREAVEALDLKLRTTREAQSSNRELRAQGEIEQAKLTSNLEYITQNCYNELGEPIGSILAKLEQANAPATEDTEAASAEDEAAREQRQAQLALAEKALAGEADEEAEPDYEPSFFTVPEDFDLVAAKQRLDELRAKIDALGPVNMMALQELGEIEERFVFLTTQKADIEKAIADTQEAIAEIKRRSRERFQDAFTQINENFKAMFVELFGGGQGEMRLIDETDILESGIEIIAQPPGKRLQNVLLLSGGEKAMTAIALVMGIFKYRPSPFCLLDEVDAPLDEMNIGRFSDKILQMSDRTQFMVITHSKRTMEVARTLYGVTMEDPGVSKLISVKLTN